MGDACRDALLGFVVTAAIYVRIYIYTVMSERVWVCPQVCVTIGRDLCEFM